ncbi:MAG: putative porin [Winogradskyella sp.]|uniref:putative porin n=1 Tax=Winogradskyella sp. TaxID=1883156 RepID=UPI0025E7D381|nr:putative porin [Winogradskyella sp.]NRB60909.1 putative porin [Winogradskyella sp.]
MKIKILALLFLSSICLSLNAQRKLTGGRVPNSGSRQFGNDSSRAKLSKGFKDLATIDMYKRINLRNDSIQVDTTLTITKDYEFNYLQRDRFGLLSFANIGQTYNRLTLNSVSQSTLPLFGARARHFNYYEEDDILYYYVPTPWTRLTYKTAFEQGQMLDAFFTVNLSKQFNFSLAYKALRSLGNYQNALTSSGNFRFTINYKSKNNRYNVKGHMVTQDLLNQENGGLKDEDIENFESGNEEFIDRSVFDPNFENAESVLEGRRFYLNQTYKIINKKDSLSTNKLSVINEISFEDKYFQFYQNGLPATAFFGDTFNNDINDKVSLENFKTTLGVSFKNNIVGDVMFAASYSDLNYGYGSIVIFPDEIITNRIKANFLGVEASYKKTLKKFIIEGKGSLNLSDEFVGSYLEGNIGLQLFEDVQLLGGININSRLPNFNYLLYQSDYINYNWNNYEDFNNVNTQQIKFSVNSEKYFNADFDVSNIDNYTYFNLQETIDQNRVIKPAQYSKPIQYFRLKLNKEIRLGNFALDNTVMYQNVISDDDVLNVPSFITRNTLYYSNDIFKKAMKLQTGITLNYFTEYNGNGYDPLLAEFYTQNETKIGGFPVLDFFVNAKIRQTRIFLKAEHFNSSFTGFNYFSAPNHPFRDFTIRFGLVWYFFL